MLEQLSVRNFAIIDHIDLELSSGMTVFSGETGAGKSLIVDALGFLLGARADTTIIRDGAQECSVSGLFSIKDNQAAIRWLEEKSISSDEEGLVHIRRTLKQNGRSSAWIDNQQVSRADLAEFTQFLVDIHGQHEHQRLMDPANHLDMLDSYAGLGPARAEYRSLYHDWKEALREYQQLREARAKRDQELDYLEFVVKEIAAAKPRPNEDADLRAEENILSQHEKLHDALSEALSMLEQGEGSDILHMVKRVRAGLETARLIDARLGSLADRATSVFYELEDVAETLSAYISSMRFDPRRLEQIQQRLAELQRLKKKYGPEISDVIEKFETSKKRIALLQHADERVSEIEARIGTLKDRVLKSGMVLSEQRMAAAAAMGTAIEAIVRRLGMPEARCRIRVARMLDDAGALKPGPDGIDEVELIIAPNPGEGEQALARIASGGELSRFALAVKTVLASRDVVETLVFDEIDAGIGGQVGVAVGEYLAELSRFRQVLCVTHLATIAAMADAQCMVQKSVSEGRTITSIRYLAMEERQAEIARMLAGSTESDISLSHAAELLERGGKNSRRG